MPEGTAARAAVARGGPGSGARRRDTDGDRPVIRCGSAGDPGVSSPIGGDRRVVITTGSLRTRGVDSRDQPVCGEVCATGRRIPRRPDADRPLFVRAGGVHGGCQEVQEEVRQEVRREEVHAEVGCEGPEEGQEEVRRLEGAPEGPARRQEGREEGRRPRTRPGRRPRRALERARPRQEAKARRPRPSRLRPSSVRTGQVGGRDVGEVATDGRVPSGRAKAESAPKPSLAKAERRPPSGPAPSPRPAVRRSGLETSTPAGAEVPSTVQRSDAHAQATWSAAHDSAVEQYGEGERAHRTAFAALKHTYEKVGDHWEAKAEAGPSDSRAASPGRDEGTPAGGVDATASRAHLYRLAQRLDIPGRSTHDEGRAGPGAAEGQRQGHRRSPEHVRR